MRIQKYSLQEALCQLSFNIDTLCLSNILLKKNIPNILFQGKVIYYIVMRGKTFKQIKTLGLFEKMQILRFLMGLFSPTRAF